MNRLARIAVSLTLALSLLLDPCRAFALVVVQPAGHAPLSLLKPGADLRLFSSQALNNRSLSAVSVHGPGPKAVVCQMVPVRRLFVAALPEVKGPALVQRTVTQYDIKNLVKGGKTGITFRDALSLFHNRSYFQEVDGRLELKPGYVLGVQVKGNRFAWRLISSLDSSIPSPGPGTVIGVLRQTGTPAQPAAHRPSHNRAQELFSAARAVAEKSGRVWVTVTEQLIRVIQPEGEASPLPLGSPGEKPGQIIYEKPRVRAWAHLTRIVFTQLDKVFQSHWDGLLKEFEEKISRDTELHELVEQALQAAPSIELEAYAKGNEFWDRRQMEGYEIDHGAVDYAYHLIAQLLDDDGREGEFGGWLQDATKEEREDGRKLLGYLPKSHPVRQAFENPTFRDANSLPIRKKQIDYLRDWLKSDAVWNQPITYEVTDRAWLTSLAEASQNAALKQVAWQRLVTFLAGDHPGLLAEFDPTLEMKVHPEALGTLVMLVFIQQTKGAQVAEAQRRELFPAIRAAVMQNLQYNLLVRKLAVLGIVREDWREVRPDDKMDRTAQIEAMRQALLDIRAEKPLAMPHAPPPVTVQSVPALSAIPEEIRAQVLRVQGDLQTVIDNGKDKEGAKFLTQRAGFTINLARGGIVNVLKGKAPAVEIVSSLRLVLQQLRTCQETVGMEWLQFYPEENRLIAAAIKTLDDVIQTLAKKEAEPSSSQLPSEAIPVVARDRDALTATPVIRQGPAPSMSGVGPQVDAVGAIWHQLSNESVTGQRSSDLKDVLLWLGQRFKSSDLTGKIAAVEASISKLEELSGATPGKHVSGVNPTVLRRMPEWIKQLKSVVSVLKKSEETPSSIPSAAPPTAQVSASAFDEYPQLTAKEKEELANIMSPLLAIIQTKGQPKSEFTGEPLDSVKILARTSAGLALRDPKLFGASDVRVIQSAALRSLEQLDLPDEEALRAVQEISVRFALRDQESKMKAPITEAVHWVAETFRFTLCGLAVDPGRLFWLALDRLGRWETLIGKPALQEAADSISQAIEPIRCALGDKRVAALERLRDLLLSLVQPATPPVQAPASNLWDSAIIGMIEWINRAQRNVDAPYHLDQAERLLRLRRDLRSADDIVALVFHLTWVLKHLAREFTPDDRWKLKQFLERMSA